MNIVPPVPGTTPGPEWASDINDILTTTIAEHNHVGPNGGVALTQAAINIDDSVNMNGELLANSRAVQLASQGSAPSENGTVYNQGGNLYYKNSSGAAVQITNGAALSGVSVGSITGLAASDGQASYNSGVFSWEKTNGNQYADMNAGTLKVFSTSDINPIYGTVISQPNTLTANKVLQLPDINLYLPTAYPLIQTQVMSIGTTGIMAASPVYSDIGTNNISTSFTTTGTSLVSSSIVGSGKCIMFVLRPTDGGSSAYLSLKNNAVSTEDTPIDVTLGLKIGGAYTDGFVQAYRAYDPVVYTNAAGGVRISPNFTFFYQPPSAGTVTYELVGTKSSNNYTVNLTYYTLDVIEVIGGLNGGF